MFARELARAYPEQVSQVFTLGSPINRDPEANNVTALFKLFNPNRQDPDHDAFQARIAPPPVPCTAIYTRDDGIVSWPCCLENDGPNTDNVEVAGTHVGLPWIGQQQGSSYPGWPVAHSFSGEGGHYDPLFLASGHGA